MHRRFVTSLFHTNRRLPIVGIDSWALGEDIFEFIFLNMCQKHKLCRNPDDPVILEYPTVTYCHITNCAWTARHRSPSIRSPTTWIFSTVKLGRVRCHSHFLRFLESCNSTKGHGNVTANSGLSLQRMSVSLSPSFISNLRITRCGIAGVISCSHTTVPTDIAVEHLRLYTPATPSSISLRETC